MTPIEIKGGDDQTQESGPICFRESQQFRKIAVGDVAAGMIIANGGTVLMIGQNMTTDLKPRARTNENYKKFDDKKPEFKKPYQNNRQQQDNGGKSLIGQSYKV